MLLTLIDNHNVSTQALERYVSRGETSGEPVLEWLAECIGGAHEMFVPYAAGAIMASTIGFINSEILDATSSPDTHDHWPLSFVEYRRLKSGDPEAYTLCIFDKYSFPSLQSYVHIMPYVRLRVDVNTSTHIFTQTCDKLHQLSEVRLFSPSLPHCPCQTC